MQTNDKNKTLNIIIMLLLAIIVVLLSFTLFKHFTKGDKSPSKSNTNDGNSKDLIQEKINTMSLEEKIGQMIILSYPAPKMDNRLANTIDEVAPGGIILFNENITTYDDTIKFIKSVKERSKIPLFISIDQEGGNVQRLNSLKDVSSSNIPYMKYVGLSGDVQNAYDIGKVIAEELGVFGINMDFAPVLDVCTNEENDLIKDRSFGNNPEIVGNMGIKLGQALIDEGNSIIPVYKHFPGHGSTTVDSHIDLPIITKSKEELLKSDIIPFKKAIDSNAKVIMVGHLSIPSITGDNTPSSMSKEIITDLLKNELGFKGLVITDSLEMEAVSKNYSIEDIYIKSVNAGVDILLMPSSSRECRDILVNAVNNGQIEMARIDDAVYKILKLKEEMVKPNYDRYLDKSNLNNMTHQTIINNVIEFAK